MTISNPHNINELHGAVSDGAFGIVVRLPQGDPLQGLLGSNWSATHWFATAAARDAALQDMRRRHEYSRPFDKPALVFEVVDREDTELRNTT